MVPSRQGKESLVVVEAMAHIVEYARVGLGLSGHKCPLAALASP